MRLGPWFPANPLKPLEGLNLTSTSPLLHLAREANSEFSSTHRFLETCPVTSTWISVAPAGTSPVVILPPTQRTQTCFGGSGVPKTCTALSWLQYPLPACTSRAGP